MPPLVALGQVSGAEPGQVGSGSPATAPAPKLEKEQGSRSKCEACALMFGRMLERHRPMDRPKAKNSTIDLLCNVMCDTPSTSTSHSWSNRARNWAKQATWSSTRAMRWSNEASIWRSRPQIWPQQHLSEHAQLEFGRTEIKLGGSPPEYSRSNTRRGRRNSTTEAVSQVLVEPSKCGSNTGLVEANTKWRNRAHS